MAKRRELTIRWPIPQRTDDGDRDEERPNDLNLTPPDPVPVVTPEKAAGLVPVDADKRSKLEEKVDGFVTELVALDANSPEFGKKVDQLTNMGRKEIADAAGQSNRFLDRPVRAMDKDSGVGADLAELRRTVEDLDPGKQGKLLAPGASSSGSSRSATSCKRLLRQLQVGADPHPVDPRQPRQRQGRAADGQRRDRRRAAEAVGGDGQARADDPHRQDARRSSSRTRPPSSTRPTRPRPRRSARRALFYVRQRTQDLLTQMAVSVQGYLALDLVKKNNVELVKGVDRATTTTVGGAAHRGHRGAGDDQPAAGARPDHRAQHDHRRTSSIRPASCCKSRPRKIHEQAAASTIPLETLQRAFQNIYDTMDEIDTFKVKALDT